MSKKVRKCCICGEKLPIGKFGNNPEPVKPISSGVCCDKCHRQVVIPAKNSGTNYAIQARGDADE